MSALLNTVSGIARLPFLPGPLRAAYALAVKRAWPFGRKPVVRAVPGVGRMELEPWDLIDSRIFFFNVWEPGVTAFMRDRVKPGDVVADIGANIGYYSLLLSQAVGAAGEVFAVEPSEPIRARLNRSIAHSGAANITVIPYGISDRAERRAFHLSGANLGASKFGEASDDGLELRRLSDVIPPDSLARLSFIKIDVEGMEDVVMRDIAAILPDLPHRLCLAAELRIDAAMHALLQPFYDAGFTAQVLPNEYTMFAYPNHPTAIRPLTPQDSGQLDVALIRG